jgi:hypothetical protein
MLTFAEFKASTAADIAGVCATSAQFMARTNEAVERLMTRGDWSGTLTPIHTCVRQGCVVWPRYVGAVRKINVCNYPIPIRNLWYDFLEYKNRSMWGGWCGAEARMIGQQQASAFSDIYGDGRFVRAYVTARADIGKTIRIFGEDNNGQVLRTKNNDGTYSDGILLTFAAPFVSTTDYVRRIDRVIKDVTQGDVRLYAYNPTTDILEDLALYSPGETVPTYSKYQLHARTWPNSTAPSQQGTCCPTMSVVALIKQRFIPVVGDTDLVQIDCKAAIKLMIQAIRYEENADRATARGFEQDAIRELNLQLRDDFPEDQTTIEVDAFSGTGIGYQKMF